VKSVKEIELYNDVLMELNYDFGDIFIFEGFIVSEIKDGVNVTWKYHGKRIVEDVTHFLGTDGCDLVYISNRMYSYSVVALDWVKFFASNHTLKAYYIVSDKPNSKLNIMIENLFFNNRIKKFDSLLAAVNWCHKAEMTEK
jgi:hypothetical protein